VVTGASSGVGRATALLYAARGARLGLLARGEEGLEATRAETERLGADVRTVAVDVADAEGIEAAASAVEDELGPIDIWINNAMLSVFSPVRDIEPEEVRRVTEVTYLGTVYGTLAALRRMLPRDRGSIVQVGSALAYRGIPLQAAYCGAKHATQGFTESVRCELLHDGSNIRITMVQLPALNTPHFSFVRTRLPRHPKPVPPIFQPEVAADAIAWAAEHGGREVNVGFSTTKALIGNKLLPGLLDRHLARTGYDSQQTREAVAPDRPHNLWRSVTALGSHGKFDAEARARSLQLWSVKRRDLLISIAAAGIVLVGIGPRKTWR
jgi:NAD(P)-dependent dehydrogenase (short-subunit alcohol dehydrogenase family)